MAISKVIFGDETLIDLTNDTVDAASLASGKTAHGADGEVITGTSTFDADTSADTATADEILAGKTAHARGTLLTGTMPNNGGTGGTISALDEPYTIPRGYSDGSAEVTIDATEAEKLIPGNIKQGVEILGVTGTLEPSEDVTAQAKTATPYTTAQTILPDTDYDYLSQVTVEAIAYAEAPNAAGGTTVTIGTVAP